MSKDKSAMDKNISIPRAGITTEDKGIPTLDILAGLTQHQAKIATYLEGLTAQRRVLQSSSKAHRIEAIIAKNGCSDALKDNVSQMMAAALDMDIDYKRALAVDLVSGVIIVPIANTDGHDYALNSPIMAMVLGTATRGVRATGSQGSNITNTEFRFATPIEVVDYVKTRGSENIATSLRIIVL
jgi:hypothetical protein